jgi:hypothetical protein
MTAERPCCDKQTAAWMDTQLAEIHTLLARELLRGTATAAVQAAEQKLHDLRNEFAALTGLGFRFAVLEA